MKKYKKILENSIDSRVSIYDCVDISCSYFRNGTKHKVFMHKLWDNDKKEIPMHEKEKLRKFFGEIADIFQNSDNYRYDGKCNHSPNDKEHGPWCYKIKSV